MAEKKIKDELKFRGLKEVSFKVMLVPATLDNIEMTLNTPQSSTTDTWEWTSAQLKDGENNDTGHRLYAGYSENGGAGNLNYDHRSNSNDNLGARLAVVILTRKRFAPPIGHFSDFHKRLGQKEIVRFFYKIALHR